MIKWKKIKSEVILDTKFFKVRRDKLEVPGKKIIDWTYRDTNDSVMILGLTKRQELVMVSQYRYLAGRWVLEFPSGKMHDSEKRPVIAARRELEEEAGYRCGRIKKLGSFYETFVQNNRMHVFLAQDLVKTKQRLDSGEAGFEDIKVRLVAFKQAIDLAGKNKIISQGTALAILLLAEKIKRKEIALDI